MRLAQGRGRRDPQRGDALYEIETDKVVNQIEATEDGILRRQLCEEGDTIDALAPVAIVETK